MPTSTDCLPWWHTKYAAIADDALGRQIVRSGCAVDGYGNVGCDPEAMRADAEAQLRGMNLPIEGLSLEAYTLARYAQSEVGIKTVEEGVAVMEAAVNKSKGDVNALLLYRQGQGHPNYGKYGPIHGGGGGVSTAPFGRWAATTSDPSVIALLLAQFVISGRSDNFSNNADDQDGPEYWVNQGQQALNNYVTCLAVGCPNHGPQKYWVGPLPGVDPWHTFIQAPGPPANTPEGQALLQRGIDALQLPMQRPTWEGLPVCSGGPSIFSGLTGSGPMSKTEIALVAISTIAGMLLASRFLRWRGEPLSL